MSWIGVVTNAGAELLAQLAQGGHVLHISGATVGSGTRETVNLRSATDLVSEEDSAQIVSSKNAGNTLQIRVRVTAIDGTAYTAKEIGIWAHLDNDATETLLQIHQETTGIQIPTQEEIPGFFFDLYSKMAVSGDAEIDVTIAQEAYATQDELAEEIATYDPKRLAVCSDSASTYTKTAYVDSMPFVLDENGNPPIGSKIYVDFSWGNSQELPLLVIKDHTTSVETQAHYMSTYCSGGMLGFIDNIQAGAVYEFTLMEVSYDGESMLAWLATSAIDIINGNKVHSLTIEMEEVGDGIAILAKGNSHAAIAQGQYVFVMDDPSCTVYPGLYTANQAIAANEVLTNAKLLHAPGALNTLKSDIATLNSNLAKIINGGLQAGQVTGISLAANSQTEVVVTIPIGYEGGNNYVAVANLEFYGSANQFSSVLIRNKYGSSFTCRIHYSGTTEITSAALNWMTMRIV